MVASRVAGTIPILIAVCFLNFPALAQYSGGSGTADDPYQIAKADDLTLLGETPEDYDKHFIMTADIDMDPNLPGRKVFDTVIGYFQGLFDGNGNVISNLEIQGETFSLGLFNALAPEAKVLNLGLVKVCVNGTGDCIGSIVGFNCGTINNCYATGSISVPHSKTWDPGIGGLVGYNEGNIATSYSACHVSADDFVGGLVGCNDGSIISCYSIGSVRGDKVIGGLVGYNYGSIATSFSSNTVVGQSDTGGLVGLTHYRGVISNCFWNTETSGLLTSDGGIGLTTAEMMDAEIIGLSALANDPNWVLDPGKDYPRLAWEGTAGVLIQQPLINWMDGDGTPEIPYQISNVNQLMRMAKSSAMAEKHFILTNHLDLEAFPSFQAVVPCFSGGINGNGFCIRNVCIQGKNRLGLIGILRGGVIKNLGLESISVEGTGNFIGGLVGVNESGNVDKCYITGKVRGSDMYWGGTGSSFVGGLVGFNWGSITESYSTVAVIGDTCIGGLSGMNGGNITTSYNLGQIRGNDFVGGLVGDNRQSVLTSYNIGTVHGTHNYIGGLVGYNRGTITMSYSTGAVSGESSVSGLIGGVGSSPHGISACFWDIESSGQMWSNRGKGKTTAEMQTGSTFLDAGWDFVGETGNGPNDVWKMWDGYDYPRLAWETGPNTPLVFVDVNDPGFYGQMSKYEVTNAQYCDFLNAALASGDITVNGSTVEGAGGSNSGEDYAGQLYYNCDGSGYTGYGAINGGAARIRYDGGAFGVDDGFGDHPVTYVSWYGAMAFARYYGYYLPAEDQWQAVADYDGTYIYGCGQTIDPGIANYRVSEHPDGTMPVGSFGAYGYGMSDMAGNVWEWTSSALGDNRVFRGGSLGSVESDCAVSIRGDGIPHAADWDIGFRVCR